MNDWTPNKEAVQGIAQEERIHPKAQVGVEGAVISESIEVLSKLASEIEARLGPVLRPIADASEEKARQAESHRNSVKEPLAPLAEFLRIRNQNLRQVILVLESILNRLEV